MAFSVNNVVIRLNNKPSNHPIQTSVGDFTFDYIKNKYSQYGDSITFYEYCAVVFPMMIDLPLKEHRQYMKDLGFKISDERVEETNFYVPQPDTFRKLKLKLRAKDKFDEFSNYRKCYDGRKTEPDFMWVTISPDEKNPKFSVEAFARLCASYPRTVKFNKTVYCIEQRGETGDDFHGCHAHFLIHRAKKPSSCIEYTQSHFIDWVGTKHHINIKFIQLDEAIRKFKYVNGTKRESKMPAALHNVPFRIKYHLDPIYTYGVSKILVDTPCNAPDVQDLNDDDSDIED